MSKSNKNSFWETTSNFITKLDVRIWYFACSILTFSLLYYFLCGPEDFTSGVVSTEKKKDDGGLKIKTHMTDKMGGLLGLIYFSFVVQSTVGFGDIAPKSNLARILVISQIIVSFILVSMS